MEQNSLTNSAGCSIMLDFMAISYHFKLFDWLVINFKWSRTTVL